MTCNDLAKNGKAKKRRLKAGLGWRVHKSWGNRVNSVEGLQTPTALTKEN